MKLAIALFSFISLGTMGCNLYGGLDRPSAPIDLYLAGKAAANDGRCDEAVGLFKSIESPSDDALIALAWAQMCVGGATAANIASSLYKFSASSSNYAAIGTLARLLVPMSGAKHIALGEAIETLGLVVDASSRALNMGVAQFAYAASILADQAAADGEAALSRLDIAAVSCEGNAGNCTLGCSAGMTDADVTSFTTTIDSAASNLSVIDAGNLKTLADALRSGLTGSTAAARCFIFNNAIPSP